MRREQRDEVGADLLLAAAQSERLAGAFLFEQDVGEPIAPFARVVEMHQPRLHPLQERNRVGEFAERAGAVGGALPISDRFRPRLAAAEMVGEELERLIAIRAGPLEGAADR